MTSQADDFSSCLAKRLALAEGAANPHDGERIAALNAAERLLASEGLRLRDLVAPLAELHQAPSAHAPPFPWRSVLWACRQRSADLPKWEREFLESLARFPKISDRQLEVLRAIAESLGIVVRDGRAA